MHRPIDGTNVYARSPQSGFQFNGPGRPSHPLHFGGSYSAESDDKNTTNSFALTGYYDTIDIIRFNGEQNEGTDTRLSMAGTYSLYQVLTPTWESELSATLSIQSGFLETAYNAVVLEDPSFPPNPLLDNQANGIEFTEELPDTRIRSAVQYKARHLFAPGCAVVVFGGGDAPGATATTTFFSANAADPGIAFGLHLSTPADSMLLLDAQGAVVARFCYGGAGDCALTAAGDESLTRSPELTGPFVPHRGAAGSNGEPFSVGTRADGTPF